MSEQPRSVASQKAATHEVLHIFGLERTEPMAHSVDLDLEQRLEPQHAATTGAYELDCLSGRFQLNRRSDFVGADGEGGGITRDEQAPRHAPAPFNNASRRVAVRRPTGRPSTIADGAVAHRPRQ